MYGRGTEHRDQYKSLYAQTSVQQLAVKPEQNNGPDLTSSLIALPWPQPKDVPKVAWPGHLRHILRLRPRQRNQTRGEVGPIVLLGLHCQLLDGCLRVQRLVLVSVLRAATVHSLSNAFSPLAGRAGRRNERP